MWQTSLSAERTERNKFTLEFVREKSIKNKEVNEVHKITSFNELSKIVCLE